MRGQSASRTAGQHEEDPRRKDPQPEEEEEGRDFPRPNERDTARLDEISEDR